MTIMELIDAYAASVTAHGNDNRDEARAAVVEAVEKLEAENAALREANEAFGKRQEWWTERMCALEAENTKLREVLVSFTKSDYIKKQHPKRYAAAIKVLGETK